MGNSHLAWWSCKFCRASLFYPALQVKLEEVIASHFQRCQAIHKELTAMFLRLAEQQKSVRQKKEEKPL